MHMNPRLLSLAFVLPVVLLGMQACDRKEVQPLPEGPQTVTGTLLPTPLSLSRGGTHVIRVGGVDVYYAESNQVNLRQYERMDVGLTGILERNIDPKALPVLIVSSVSQQDIVMKRVEIATPKLSLSVPENWNMKAFDDGVRFTMTGSAVVFLRIYPSTLTQLPAAQFLQVGGLRAARIDTASGSTVHVQNNRSIISFTYDAQASDNPQEFERILHSITFGQAASSAMSNSGTGAVTGGGDPCGGVAGILCPAGQYCEVTDNTTGVGKCRALKR